MNIVPHYDMPPGTELTAQSRTVVVCKKSDDGYHVADQITGRDEFISYVVLARFLQQSGTSIRKPQSEMSARMTSRLGAYQTFKALPAKQQEAADFSMAICHAIKAIHDDPRRDSGDPNYRLSQRKLNDPDMRDCIAKKASDFFGKKIRTNPAAGGRRMVWQLPKGRTLNEMYNTYLACNLQKSDNSAIDPHDALIPCDHLKGNRKPRINWLIKDMMTEATEKFSRESKKNSTANIHHHLGTLIYNENERRRANGLPLLEVPSPTTLARHKASLYSPTEALLSDEGERAAKAKRGRGSTDIPALMIGEATEIDENKLSLITTAKICGLWERLSDPDKQAFKDADEEIRTRLTLLVLLDLATRMPLAWVISDQPRAEATLALLRMATRDKTREKLRYGCTGLVADAVGLGVVKNDNGPGLRNAPVKAAILGCGGVSVDVRTYSPTDKPFIERHFGTLESILLKILHGYTGRRAGELPGYDAHRAGVLDVDALYELISVFYIDELPSMRHYGVGMWGRRPAEVYEEINRTRGALAPMDPDLRRIHLCWEEQVTPTDEGVRVYYGIWFNSDALQEAIEDPQGYAKSRERKVSVFVDPDNLNEATVVLPLTAAPIRVQLQTSIFADMTVNEALNLIQEYRREDPRTTQIHEDRLARVRRDRAHLLDTIGVEKGLSRSYVTRDEIKAKARALFRGARIIPSERIPDAVAAGQITAERPDGMVFDVSDGDSGILDGTAFEAAADEPVVMDVISAPDEPQEASLSKEPATSHPKKTARKRARIAQPEHPQAEVFGRPEPNTRLK